MDAQQLAQAWAEALNAGNIDTIAPHVADNFVLEATSLPEPQSWDAYLDS